MQAGDRRRCRPARRVTLGDGATLAYDRLVLAPGIDLRFDALPGYDEAAAEAMPHAWKAGPQTLAPAPPARGDGGRRHGRHGGAGEPLPLPARPLRAGEPDRPLPQDAQAALQAPRPRRQGRVLEAAPVPGGLGGALSRTARMGVALGRRQGHGGRAGDAAPSSPSSAPPGRRRQRHPAAAGRAHRRRPPASPTAPAGARSIRSPSSRGCSRAST